MAEPGTHVLIHNDVTAALAAQLREALPGVAVSECQDYASLPGRLARTKPDVVYTVRFAGSEAYPRDALLGPDGPKWIANGGVGTDHFGQWDTDRTTITNAAGVAASMMAEYILGGFLHFTLDVPGLQADQAAHRWQARRVRPLAAQTLLIVGLGSTGQALAARAQAFGMKVIGTRARPRPMDHVDEVHGSDALPGLLPRANFIAICTPLVPRTRGLIDAAALALVKPGTVLADVSRGGVVDQGALARALSDGRLRGAAVDVFETEPLPADSPLWDISNLLISPHCSAVHAGWAEDSFALFLANLRRWCRGEPLKNIVDPSRGY